MKNACVSILTVAILATICGCGSPQAVKTGFLSDYSKLRNASGNSKRYANSRALADYSLFIVDRVETRFGETSTARRLEQRGEMTLQNRAALAGYMRSAATEAVENAGAKVVHAKAPRVARIRIAITDVQKTNIAVSALPIGRVATAAGTGGASMEAEIVDSVTGEQLAAFVQGQSGSRIPLTGMSDWGGAEHAMEQWAKQLQRTIQDSRR